jgi:hypothetical protein
MSQNTISTFVSSQVPGFVREDHPLFVSFLEAYYEYLEQTGSTLATGKVVERAKNWQEYNDIDTTISDFADKLGLEFLALFQKQAPKADKDTILKNVKDFYRARGSEKSYRFLFQAIFGKTPELYYPSTDVLRPSTGKWFIERSIRIENIKLNGANTAATYDVLNKFINTRVTGSNSNAYGLVERVLISFESNQQISEVFVSNIYGVFQAGEKITATNLDGDTFEATIITGQLLSITVTYSGQRYNIGDPVQIQSNSGTGGIAFVSSTGGGGNIASVVVSYGGAGFVTGDLVSFTGGGGTGANAIVGLLDGVANSFYHANTFNVLSDIILTYANTTLNVANYGFPAFANSNANTVLANAFTSFSFGPCGPISTSSNLAITLLTGGADYTAAPAIDVQGNVFMKALGIIGRITVNTPGANYSLGDWLTFDGNSNIANANVIAINANGGIQRIQFRSVNGLPPGGMGYNPLSPPTVGVISANGAGANLTVGAFIAYGAPYVSAAANTPNVAGVATIAITNRGRGYGSAPTINLRGIGDGTALAYANITVPVFTYPGRYLDDTGFPSSYNFLQDRDYYQPYSYVVKITQSIVDYKQYLLDLIHPAGTKVWGEYQFINANTITQTINVANTAVVYTDTGSSINAASFAAANAYMYRTAALANISNSSVGTFSAWINPKTLPASGATQLIYGIGTQQNVRFSVSVANTGTPNMLGTIIQVRGYNAANILTLSMNSNTGQAIVANNWQHVVVSYNTANANASYIYIGDVKSTNSTYILANGNVNYSVANSFVAGYAANNKFDGSMSELYLANAWIDLSNTTNRRKFVSANLWPTYLGPTGNTPTGNSAIVYLNFVPPANTNLGLGGNYIANGTISVSNTSPVSG